jgi:heme-degrading monooxygenase HmoA
MLLVVFRARAHMDVIEESAAIGEELKAIAQSMPGFVDYKEYAAEDGEFVTIVMFEDAAALRAWREHPRHREAITLGYDRWMSSYDIAVCEVQRRYTRDERVKAVAGGAPVPGSLPVWDYQVS